MLPRFSQLLFTSAATAVLTVALSAQPQQQQQPDRPAKSPATQPTAPAALASENPVQPSPPPTRPAPAPRKRTISSDLAATLAAGLPKYDQIQPPPEPTPEEELVDMRDIDKPQNTIIRLPKYVVEGQRPPVFRERDLYTERGLGALAASRYLSQFDRGILNRFILPFIGMSPEARAMIMYEDDERLRHMAEFNQAADHAEMAGDTAGSEYLRRESAKTFMRRTDFGWSKSQ